jgi:hypothetical protein
MEMKDDWGNQARIISDLEKIEKGPAIVEDPLPFLHAE